MSENYNNRIEELFRRWMDIMDTPDKDITQENIVERRIDWPPKKKKKKGQLDFSSAQHVKAFLKSLPKDLRKMFTPTTDDEIMELEIRLIQFNRTQKERDQVMQVQKKFDIPLHPRMTLEKVAVYARIALLKKKLQKKYEEDNYKDPSSEDPMPGN